MSSLPCACAFNVVFEASEIILGMIETTRFTLPMSIVNYEIDKVERVVVPAIILGLYKSNAYVVYSKDYKITILIKTGEVFTILYNKIEKYLR